MTKSIDRIDRKILKILQQEGRISNVDLATRINLSPTPCLERVRRLEQAGYITGYAALLAPDLLDAGLTIFVQVTLDRTTSDIFERFTQAVHDVAPIVECHMIAGGFDYLLKLRVKDMAAFRQHLGDVINQLPGVISTSSYVAMETVKEGPAIPLASAH